MSTTINKSTQSKPTEGKLVASGYANVTIASRSPSLPARSAQRRVQLHCLLRSWRWPGANGLVQDKAIFGNEDFDWLLRLMLSVASIFCQA